MVLLTAASGWAAELKPETIRVWDDCVQRARERMQNRLTPGAQFLWTEENPARARRVRTGEIVVEPATHPEPHPVPGGLIHDWIGAAFLPGVSGPDVLAVLRDFSNYKEIYKPYVVDSREISAGTPDRFAVVLRNKTIILKTALDGEYAANTERVGPHRWYTTMESTRLREVEDFGTPEQHFAAEGRGALIWRLFNITRYEERDGGVYIETEALALTREVPYSLRWLMDPMVRRISRGSLETTLRETGAAVHERALTAHRAMGGGAAH